MADLTGMLQAAAGQVGGEYEISRSLRFNSADSAYLSRTPASASNRKTWTWSGWAKRSAGTGDSMFGAYVDGNNRLRLNFENDAFEFFGSNGGVGIDVRTSAVYRDYSAWYHFVLAFDTTQATASNRVKFYVNGTQVTSFATTSYPAQDSTPVINNNVAHYVGQRGDSTDYFNGYMTEMNFIDGQALTPTDFGEFNSDTGVWQPIEYTGTYGTNGFYLPFSDNASTTTLGNDFSGNGNDWTTNNFSVTAGAGNDSLVDSPTRYGTDTGAGGEVRGNYCTLNPLNVQLGAGSLTNGNLQFTGPSGSAAYNFAGGTFVIDTSTTTGWYFEVNQTTYGAFAGVSLWDTSVPVGFLSTDYPIGFSGNASAGITYRNSGAISNYGTNTTGLTTWSSNGDVIGVAIKDNKIWFAKNGTWISGDPAAGTSPSITLASTKFVSPAGTGINSNVFNYNFGQRPFAYTAPSGFKALCTTNLPDPTVVQGDDYFNTVLYTGTGSSLGVTGVGFQPDFTWIKERSGAADHALYDAVRGVQQQLESNTTTDETTESTGLTAFVTGGFTVGALAQVNTNNDTYVAWNWKESTTSKFDIVTYTGNGSARTISHNLGVVPNMIIVKARTTASTDQGWAVYHSANTAAPETDYLLLNSTAATADLDTVWNDTAPTSSVFSVGTNALVNANNDTYVAYLFANVAGFSAFGSYTANANADGPFIYTGFRPAFILIKASGLVQEWVMLDNKRLGYNPTGTTLNPNTSDAENTGNNLDLVSNGFKVRASGGGVNFSSGQTYIYACFSSNPFKFALAR